MFKTLYADKDATLYSRFPTKNTGVDEILELGKWTAGTPSIENDVAVYYDSTHNSRILIYFDLTATSASISAGRIGSDARFYLVLRTTEAVSLPYSYTVYAYPVSASWQNGVGHYNNDPAITEGVSWQYRDSALAATQWLTSSYNANSTGSFGSVGGGGTWYTNYVSSQSFSHELPDVRMDVTTIVNAWISGSIPNNGMIVKFHDAVERDSSIFGQIKFFSTETHTIYIPRLEAYWDDSVNTGTGSFAEVSDEDFVLYAKNLRATYTDSEVSKIKLGSRPRYPVRTYTTSSNYLISNRIPTSSYYQIQDVVTDEVIIPFNTLGTKVSCDSNGNYIKLDCASLLPERFYKLVFKCVFSDAERYIDDGHIFRITRV